MNLSFPSLEYFSQLALDQAHRAFERNEVPVGCVLIDKDEKILFKGHNLKEKNQNPLHHCELLAIEQACKTLKNWRLMECSLFVTLEPCCMCFSALISSRIKNLYFGAYDPKGGALSTKIFQAQNPQLNHQFSVMGGVGQLESSQLLSHFFSQRRKFYKKQ